MKTKTFRIVLLALFIALCAVGAYVKIMDTIAFDSLPAFLAAMLLGKKDGAIAGALGHLFTTLLTPSSGIPIPLHFVIAAEMAAICWLLGWMVQNKNFKLWISAIVAFILNGFISPLILLIWPEMGLPIFLMFIIPLVIGSAANVALAAVLAKALKKPLKRYLVAQQ